jgi:pimeloyl-ACP methyl ester carboxylesterase
VEVCLGLIKLSLLTYRFQQLAIAIIARYPNENRCLKMKLKLLILSDLWGFDDTPWIANYEDVLSLDFQIIRYDLCELAGIDKTHLTEKELHTQFIDYGITNAIIKLLELEKEKVTVLAFSMGGTIAWKAALEGLKITKLYAVSSTRLRYELKRPNCDTQLVFGEKDPFIPKNIWFKKLNLEPEMIKNGQHDIYKKESIATILCHRIKMQ